MLSTVHSAKGLEWDAVHLIAAYDGNFPADMSTGTRGGDRRGATAVLRRAHASPPPAARVRPVPLLPPPARPRRRSRLRQGVALPDRRCEAVDGGDARARPRGCAARRPAPPRAGSRYRSTPCSADAQRALVARCDTGRCGIRPARPPPASRQGRRGQPLLRAAGRRATSPAPPDCRARTSAASSAGLRRAAAQLSADAASRAGRRAAAEHRPLRRRHLPLGGAAERRLVHDELHADVRPVADGLPRRLPAGRPAGARARPASCAPTDARNTARFEKTASARCTSLAGDRSSRPRGADR